MHAIDTKTGEAAWTFATRARVDSSPVVAEGRVPVGHMVMEFGTRGLAMMARAADLDFVLLDMEHTAFGMDRMGDLAALRARLGAAKVGFAEADGAVVVPPAEAFGFALGFVQRSKR